MTHRAKPPLAWLQLTADPMRLFAAVAGISFAVVLMLMQLAFRDALFTSAVLSHIKLQCDLVMIGVHYAYLGNTDAFTHRRLFQALADPEVASVTRCYASRGRWKNTETHVQTVILVHGFDPNRAIYQFANPEHLLEQIRLEDTVLFDRASKPIFGTPLITQRVERGETVQSELSGRRVKVAGLFEMGANFIADGNVITSELNFLRIFPQRHLGVIDFGAINLKPGADPLRVQTRLNAVLPPDVRTLTKKEFVARERRYWDLKTPTGYIFNLGVLVGFIVGTVIVYQIIYTDVMTHLGEYATLKAMGYTDRALFGVVGRQALILSVLGFIPGTAFAMMLYALTRTATRLPTYMTLERATGVLLLTILMCGISGALAMRKLKLADPADIF